MSFLQVPALPKPPEWLLLGERARHNQPGREIEDIQKPRHHQPNWQTHALLDEEANELPDQETNQLETSGEPDTTSQIGREHK